MSDGKKQRETVFKKYNGKCAYCGCDLQKGWHVDHFKPVVRCLKTGKHDKPENECLENYMPSCASCNIIKSSLPLESFRDLVYGFITSLNRDSTQYKIAKRYGMIEEKLNPVVFYFEKVGEIFRIF